jgi:hypothetical protein
MPFLSEGARDFPSLIREFRHKIHGKRLERGNGPCYGVRILVIVNRLLMFASIDQKVADTVAFTPRPAVRESNETSPIDQRVGGKGIDKKHLRLRESRLRFVKMAAEDHGEYESMSLFGFSKMAPC